MAEWSKALDLSSSGHQSAQVRTLLEAHNFIFNLTLKMKHIHIILVPIVDSYINF